MSKLISRQTALTGNIILMSRFLRSKGFTITTNEEEDAMNALSLILPTSEYRFWTVLRAVFSKNKFQFENFEDYYIEYKFEIDKAKDSKINEKPTTSQNTSRNQLPSLESLKHWLYNKTPEDEVNMSSYSSLETLAKKDFAAMSQEEINLVLGVLKRLSRKILRRKSRTRKISKRKQQVDLRMTFRHNFRTGGEIKEIIFSERKIKKLKLILMCDVSRSMNLYSRFFIHLIYAFQNGYDRIETFVFSTALHHISEILSNHDCDTALDMIAERVPQWSGGTKIGYCLNQFCTQNIHSMVDRKTVVMILSDGWDTGEPEIIKEAMKKIHKFCRKLIWLNPLAGQADFKPEVLGLKSTLPYITHLLPAHNLESLKSALKIL